MKAIDGFRAGIVLVVTAAAGCGAPPSPKTPARAVRTAPAVAALASGELRYSASIEPKTRVALAFKVGGYVSEILEVRGEGGAPHLLQQGDFVRRGTILASLDAGDLEQHVHEAEGQRSEAIASLDRARADAGRAERLYAAHSLTRPDYDAATAARAIAEARLTAAEAQLAAAGLTFRDSKLTAPIDAVVLSRRIEPGTLAHAGTVAFELADVSVVKAVFGVPDRLVGTLATGQVLSVETGGATATGRITAISPSADGASRVFGVEVMLENRGRALRPGMIATVTIHDASGEKPRPATLSVPLTAVVKSPDGAYAVFVVEGDGDSARAKARRVELGPIVGGRITVTAGLSQDEPVIVSGAALLADGEPVHVIP